MEKRSTPNKTAKYVLVFILIAAAAAVLIFCLVNNNKSAQAKAYGESATGTAFDIASGLLRLKIRDEQGSNYLILLFDADAAATDALLEMVGE